MAAVRRVIADAGAPQGRQDEAVHGDVENALVAHARDTDDGGSRGQDAHITFISLLNREIVQVLNKREVKDLLFRDGTEVVGSSPQEFAASINAEMATLGKVIKAAGIRTE